MADVRKPPEGATPGQWALRRVWLRDRVEKWPDMGIQVWQYDGDFGWDSGGSIRGTFNPEAPDPDPVEAEPEDIIDLTSPAFRERLARVIFDAFDEWSASDIAMGVNEFAADRVIRELKGEGA